MQDSMNLGSTLSLGTHASLGHLIDLKNHGERGDGWDSWRKRHAASGATAIYFLVLSLTARHVSLRAHEHEPHTSHGLVMSY